MFTNHAESLLLFVLALYKISTAVERRFHIRYAMRCVPWREAGSSGESPEFAGTSRDSLALATQRNAQRSAAHVETFSPPECSALGRLLLWRRGCVAVCESVCVCHVDVLCSNN